MPSWPAWAVLPTAPWPTSPAWGGSRTSHPWPAGARWRATSSPARDRSGTDCTSRAPWRAALAVVAEGFVPFPHGLAEADVPGAPDEVEPLLGVAGDAVEEAAEQ